MIDRIRKARDEDSGFTLIELLVVVIIIGILAAIAIPVFLNQRERAWDSAAQSDVRNMATSQESYYTSGSSYTGTVSDLVSEGFTKSDSVTHAAAINGTGSEFVVCASHSDSSEVFYWDSSNPTVTNSYAGSLTCAP